MTRVDRFRRDAITVVICALGTRDGSMVPAAQMERYEPVAEVSTWPRTEPDIDPGTAVIQVIGDRVWSGRAMGRWEIRR